MTVFVEALFINAATQIVGLSFGDINDGRAQFVVGYTSLPGSLGEGT